MAHTTISPSRRAAGLSLLRARGGPTPPRIALPAAGLALASALAFLVTSCSAPTPGSTGPASLVPTVEGWETAAIETAGATPEPVPIVIGLPYKPDVQFTPLYVAAARGYYEDEGLAPKFEYGDESAFVRVVAGRKMPAMIGSGEQVIMARAEKVPVTYVMTWYQRFPGVVFSDDPEINTPSDLVGRKVGLPALSGASYTGWRALLAANDIDDRDITTEVVGFTQLEAVTQDRVDAAVGYAANEPVQMRAMGIEPTVIEIADTANIVSNGLIVAESMIYDSPTLVQSLVTATLKGIRDTLEDPDAAFDIFLQQVPEANDPAVIESQRAVLEASLPYYRSKRLGAIDYEAWTQTQNLLLSEGMIDEATPVDQMIDVSFVENADLGE